MSAGPFDLDAGSSVTVPFAVVGGDDYAGLVANVVRAQEIYYALTVGIPDEEPVEYRLELGQNRPNPFNPVTKIAFSLPAAAEATLAVFDIAGRRVVTQVDREVEAGCHEVVWNGTNEAGEPVASGVYFSRLTVMGEEHSAKMVLLK